MKLILLAAGKSSRIYNKINKNKCLIEINGKSLIQNIIDSAIEASIKKIEVITGFKPNNIKNNLKNFTKIKFIKNTRYKTTDMVYSAILGLKKSKCDIIISYTDIFYEKNIFIDLIKSKKKSIVLPYIKNWKDVWKSRKKNIYEDAETFMINSKSHLKEIGNKIDKDNLKAINGQFMGIIYIPKEYINLVVKFYEENNNKKLQFTGFLNKLINKNVKINCIEYKGFWYEIDDFDDYNNFGKFFLKHSRKIF